MYLKSGILGWRPNKTTFWLITSPPVMPTMVKYWSQYITIIENRFLVQLLRPFSHLPGLKYDTFKTAYVLGKMHMSISPAMYEIQRAYESEFDGVPLLNLDRSDTLEGRLFLERAGMPSGSWFVCVHARESGYRNMTHQAYRDSDITTYLPAIQAIVERGGWVFRMGDPSMKSLPPMCQVVDYVHTSERNEKTDAFLYSQCRFILGTSSGPHNVGFVFGVPSVLVNFTPMGEGPLCRKDLWIPKLYWSEKAQRYLTFRESLQSQYRRFISTNTLADWGISVVDNTPKEIADITVEMINRLDYGDNYSDHAEELQTCFKRFLESDPRWATSARVGTQFLRDRSDLLV